MVESELNDGSMFNFDLAVLPDAQIADANWNKSDNFFDQEDDYTETMLKVTK